MKITAIPATPVTPPPTFVIQLSAKEFYALIKILGTVLNEDLDKEVNIIKCRIYDQGITELETSRINYNTWDSTIPPSLQER